MATPTWKGPLDQLVEANNSPQYEVSDRIFKTRIYHGLFSFCESSLPDFSKGTSGSGDETGYTVASAKLSKVRGNIGQLSVQWEASSSGSGQTLPPDEVAVNPDNLNPRIEKHPNYAGLDEIDLDNVDIAVRGQNEADRTAAYALCTATGQELVDKIRKGNESYYLAALRYSWVTHSWTIPSSTRGGYTEAISGPLASYFVGTISWLREADSLQYQNGIWRLTKNWLGAADGHWDADIY